MAADCQMVVLWGQSPAAQDTRLHRNRNLRGIAGMRLKRKLWCWLNLAMNTCFTLFNGVKKRIEEYKADDSPEVVRGLF